MSHDELISLGFSFKNLIGLYYHQSILNDETNIVLYLEYTNLGHTELYSYRILTKGLRIGASTNCSELEFRKIISNFKSDILDNKINNILRH